MDVGAGVYMCDVVVKKVYVRYKPNSITLASSDSEPASVMEFGREPASSC